MEIAKKMYLTFRKALIDDLYPSEDIEQKFGVSMSDEGEHFALLGRPGWEHIMPSTKMPIGKIVFNAWLTLKIAGHLSEDSNACDQISEMLYQNRLGEWFEKKLRSLPNAQRSAYVKVILEGNLFDKMVWDPIFQIGDEVQTRNMKSSEFKVPRIGTIVNAMERKSRRYGVKIPELKSENNFLIKAENLTRKLPVESVE